jgi:hypothetical protein
MSTDQVRVERRSAQRFDFHLPVSIRLAGNANEEHGFTQDLSARGAFLFTDCLMAEGDAVELTLVMPSEITLAENMRVRCRGRVVRVSPAAANTKSGVAVHLEGYEFLPQTESVSSDAGAFERISALHQHARDEDAGVGSHEVRARSATLP